LPESAGSDLLSRFVLAGTGGTSPWWLIHLPDPFCHIPFFGKAKYRNLEISRPYSGSNPKFRVLWRPILILNSGLKAYQKMVTAIGTIGSKSKPTSLRSVQPPFFSFNLKIKNGKRSGYKK
jgi:hypothetical protein